MSEYSEKMVASAQRRYEFEQWSYQQVYSELVDWMAVIYEKLSPESIQEGAGLPSFEIKKLGRTIVSKYKHSYTGGGTLGMVAFNTLYLNENPTENQLIYFVMLLAHDLCQCLAMREKTDKKIAPHGREVKELFKQVGIVWNGAKAHLSFTDDSWLKTRLTEAYPEAMQKIVYPEILPAPEKKAKPEQMMFIVPNQAKPVATNAQEPARYNTQTVSLGEYAKLKQDYEDLQKKHQESVTINEKNSTTDELYCNFYTCPHCQDKSIIQGSNYCLNCGYKIDWVELEIEPQEEQEEQEEQPNAQKS